MYLILTKIFRHRSVHKNDFVGSNSINTSISIHVDQLGM